MSKIKLTKGELKRQRDALAQFRHYLPTLQLKKQQLQLRIREAQEMLEGRQKDIDEKMRDLDVWVGLLGEPDVDLMPYVAPEKITVKEQNVAGANIQLFEGITFPKIELDFYATPLWMDEGIQRVQAIVALLAEMRIIRKEVEVLQRELRITTQRVNLFEKIKIPECQEAIRRIRIYLGDQQANAVGIGKVAKKKISEKEMQEVA